MSHWNTAGVSSISVSPILSFFSGKKYVERISGFSMVFIFEILYIKATKNEYVSLHYNVYKNNIMSKIKCI